MEKSAFSKLIAMRTMATPNKIHLFFIAVLLSCLAESYAGGGSMTENIDKVGGAGTGAFAKKVIDLYIEKLQ